MCQRSWETGLGKLVFFMVLCWSSYELRLKQTVWMVKWTRIDVATHNFLALKIELLAVEHDTNVRYNTCVIYKMSPNGIFQSSQRRNAALLPELHFTHPDRTPPCPSKSAQRCQDVTRFCLERFPFQNLTGHKDAFKVEAVLMNA